MATNYSINYEDERFKNVETEKQAAIDESTKVYDNMIGEADKYYQEQINAAKDYANTQQELQQQNTDFAIEQVNQQKEQAQKDYIKEQKGAYVDWQKESNRYGVNAEQQAASGLTGGGYSESSQVSMYNTYQNRVATARESYNRAVLNYDNAIKDAMLKNNSALAEIAYQALQTELELALSGFQYKNTLILEQAAKKQELEDTYYNRWQDVLSQINKENTLAEEVRQYNENLALQKAQIEEEKRRYNESLKLQKSSRSYSGGGSGGSGSISKSSYAVNTAYYRGDLNNDANKYGTFSNGYQPKGISGHGKLSKTGDTITFETQTLYGQKQILTQNLWRAEDGTTWYWDGFYNQYIPKPYEGSTNSTKSSTKSTKSSTKSSSTKSSKTSTNKTYTKGSKASTLKGGHR